MGGENRITGKEARDRGYGERKGREGGKMDGLAYLPNSSGSTSYAELTDPLLMKGSLLISSTPNRSSAREGKNYASG